jgi:hypothetical protein
MVQSVEGYLNVFSAVETSFLEELKAAFTLASSSEKKADPVEETKEVVPAEGDKKAAKGKKAKVSAGLGLGKGTR